MSPLVVGAEVVAIVAEAPPRMPTRPAERAGHSEPGLTGRRILMIWGLPGSGRSAFADRWLAAAPAGTARTRLAAPSVLSSDSLAEMVDRALGGPAGEPHRLVIDDLDEICDPEAGAAAVAGAVEQRPGLELAICARQRLPALATRHDVLEVRGADRTLDVAAVAGLLAERGVAGSPDDVARLVETTGGLPGLVRAALSAWRPGDRIADLEPGLVRARAAFAEQVSLLPTDVLDLLRTACVVGAASSEELRDLHGPAAEPALVTATDHGLVLVRDARSGGLVPVPVVRKVLLDEFERDEPARVQELRTRLLRRREELGDADCGLGAAWELRDWTSCARIIDRWTPELSYGGFRPLLLRVMHRLPPEVAADWPGAAHWAAHLGRLPAGRSPIRVPGDREEARADFVTRGDLSLRRLFLPLVTPRRHGRTREGAEVARKGRLLAEECGYEPGDRRAGFVSLWYLQAGVNELLADDLPAARGSLLRSWTFRTADRIGFAGRDAAGKLALLEALCGDRSTSLAWLDRARAAPRLPEVWVDGFIEDSIVLAPAIHAVDALDPRADELLQRALHPVERNELWAITLWALTRRLMMLGRVSDAHQQLDEVVGRRTRQSADGLAARMVAQLTAELLLCQGKGTPALAALPGEDPTGSVAALRAQVHLRADDPSEALRVLAERRARPEVSLRAETELLVAAAEAAHRLGDRGEAVARLAAAARLAVPQQNLGVFAAMSREVLTDLAHDVPGVREALDALTGTATGQLYPDSVELIALTERERALLDELPSERPLTAIARDWFVSVNTVRTHLAGLRRKLGARSRAEVVRRARHHGLLAARPR